MDLKLKKKICNKSRIEVVKTDGAESKRAVAIERTEREPRQVVNSREEFENRKLSEKVRESRVTRWGISCIKGDKLRKTGMADQQLQQESW